ncbi:uncharacterized protein LOC110893522 [Helianthus annuus]|uniref:uncharacterized protein LOC110893522 n=1 Tax=Helianthus annuus TaxID=4232 RepID=UPI000B908268|nr:uncharacterized protein LOC110893522 [Helianthus annuus]
MCNIAFNLPDGQSFSEEIAKDHMALLEIVLQSYEDRLEKLKEKRATKDLKKEKVEDVAETKKVETEKVIEDEKVIEEEKVVEAVLDTDEESDSKSESGSSSSSVNSQKTSVKREQAQKKKQKAHSGSNRIKNSLLRSKRGWGLEFFIERRLEHVTNAMKLKFSDVKMGDESDSTKLEEPQVEINFHSQSSKSGNGCVMCNIAFNLPDGQSFSEEIAKDHMALLETVLQSYEEKRAAKELKKEKVEDVAETKKVETEKVIEDEKVIEEEKVVEAEQAQKKKQKAHSGSNRIKNSLLRSKRGWGLEFFIERRLEHVTNAMKLFSDVKMGDESDSTKLEEPQVEINFHSQSSKSGNGCVMCNIAFNLPDGQSFSEEIAKDHMALLETVLQSYEEKRAAKELKKEKVEDVAETKKVETEKVIEDEKVIEEEKVVEAVKIIEVEKIVKVIEPCLKCLELCKQTITGLQKTNSEREDALTMMNAVMMSKQKSNKSLH